MNFFLEKCKFRELAGLSDLESAGTLMAAAIHDYDHPYFNSYKNLLTLET